MRYFIVLGILVASSSAFARLTHETEVCEKKDELANKLASGPRYISGNSLIQQLVAGHIVEDEGKPFADSVNSSSESRIRKVIANLKEEEKWDDSADLLAKNEPALKFLFDHMQSQLKAYGKEKEASENLIFNSLLHGVFVSSTYKKDENECVIVASGGVASNLKTSMEESLSKGNILLLKARSSGK